MTDALGTLRARVTRDTSLGLALLTVAALAAVWSSEGTGPALLGLGIGGALYQAVVAAMPWRRWVAGPHGGRWTVAHLAVTVLLIAVAVALAPPQLAPSLPWLLALTTTMAAATRTPAGQVATGASSASALLLAGSLGGSLEPGQLLVPLAALAALGWLLGASVQRYLQAVAGVASARRALARGADRALALGEASRALAAEDPDAVLEAVVATTERLGYGYSGVYAHDVDAREVLYVAARGLSPELRGSRFPDDLGVAGWVLREGRTVVMADYPRHPRANPAFTDLLRCAIGTPIRDTAGVVTGVLVCGRGDGEPISQVDQQVFELLAAHAGRALAVADRLRDERARVAELAELDRLKSDFLSIVSHELRTPLTVVCGLTETLTEHDDRLDPALRRTLLQRVRANAVALDDVIATLLDFGRLDAGHLEPQLQPTVLAEVVRAVVSRLEPVLATHRVRTELTTEAAVRADGRLLERVIENLLTNATRHTPDGTTVRIAVGADDGDVRVEVTDEGAGIPDEELARLGERFFRGGAPDTRPTRGVGLGLALAREVLELHGSALEIRSTLGQGSAFAFALPVADAAAERGAGDGEVAERGAGDGEVTEREA